MGQASSDPVSILTKFLKSVGNNSILTGLVVVIVAAALVVLNVGVDTFTSWLHHEPAKSVPPKETQPAADLVRNKDGQPVSPPTLQLSPRAASALGINKQTTFKAVAPKNFRALPPQTGSLAYDSDRLYAVRSRFAGEVSQMLDAPADQMGSIPLKPSTLPPLTEEIQKLQVDKPRPFTVGDRVKKGDLLAIVWSKDLGDKKAALIDALIDLRRDNARLVDLEKLYYEGSVPAATFFEAQRTVQKDLSARNAAERTLRMWKLEEAEIEALKKEAETIQAEKRDARKEKDWARVEVRALTDGIIVEKNTHMGDWVDPANYGTPMYRIADLSKLQVWINPAEEYLSALQDFLKQSVASPLAWDIFLQADPRAAPLTGELLRLAPSLDPTQHTPLLVGLVDNPAGRLLVGQFVTATIYVPLEDDLVEIPTDALNEEKGQSVVFVQRDPEKLEFSMRAVDVVHRFKDVVYVRSKAPKKQADTGPDVLRVEALEPGDRVVTQSIVELTQALRDLRARERLAKLQ
jgi:membrane fusion protein, heavy metal efflux system